MSEDKIQNAETSWESPEEAAEWCFTQPDAVEALVSVVRYNVDLGEFGFASDVVLEFDTAGCHQERKD